jgi:LacI family transcriptional regulator
MSIPLAVVAAEAGVSVPTVSKVLNSRPDVAAATRRRVTEVLQRHGYDVRQRPRRSTGLLDVRIVNLDGAWAETVVRGAAMAAGRHGKDLVLTVDPDPDDCDGWVRRALARGTDGVLSVVAAPSAAAREAIAEAGIPCVVVDPLHRPPEGVQSIAATNFQGGLDATAHLLSLGHRRIATITGSLDQDNAIARLAGFRAAMLRAGVTVEEDLVIHAQYGVDQGYNRTQRLLASAEPPTAIFAASDDTALGAIRAIRDAGLHVPDDISVIGFDDLSYARWTDPPLTTISQPLIEMGDSAVELLMRSPERPGRNERIELSTRLVVRGSTAHLNP